MIDSQKPDPNAYWCMKCRGHIADADVTEVEKRYPMIGKVHDLPIVKGCRACSVEVGIPLECRSESLGLLRWGIVIAVVFEYWAISSAVTHGFDLEGIVMIFATPLVFIFCGLIYTLIDETSLLWWKWKKWAKERGWEEEQPKGD